jgi:hypothetical protein
MDQKGICAPLLSHFPLWLIAAINIKLNRALMKKETSIQTKESPSNKKPLDQRENPMARDSRGSAKRDEIRAQTPMVSAPRQSQKPMERSNQKRAHKR